MTMIDDDTLVRLMAQAADSFAAPENGAAVILERAMTTPTTDEHGAETDASVADLARARARRVQAVAGAHRILSVAAVLVLALAIAGGATWLGHTPNKGQPALTAGPTTSQILGSSKDATVPSTTIPGFAAEGGTASGSPAGGAASSATGGTPTLAAPAPLGTATAPAASSAAGAGASSSNAAATVPNAAASRIEQTGSLSLTVAKGALAKTMTELTFLAGAYNGFVATSQTESGALATTGAASGSITLQVPEGSFASVLKKAQALGTTQSLTTKATDVTGQFVDLAARIAALQASRQQYLTIMAKATSIGDVLSVQSQLDSIESQIEQLQGQLNELSSQTTYSTLTVLVSEHAPAPHHHPASHRSGLAKAWHASVHGFVAGVDGLVRLAGPTLFVLLCGLVLIVGGRTGWRRYRRRGL